MLVYSKIIVASESSWLLRFYSKGLLTRPNFAGIFDKGTCATHRGRPTRSSRVPRCQNHFDEHPNSTAVLKGSTGKAPWRRGGIKPILK
jgi:hypothetical protein